MFLSGLASLVVPVPKAVKLPMSSMYGVRYYGAGSTARAMALFLAHNSIYGKIGRPDRISKYYGVDLKTSK